MIRAFVLIALSLGLALPMRAELTVAKVFSDHAVLQQGRQVPVWGTAEPGAKVTVRFKDRVLSVRADERGKWRADLPPLTASADPAVLEVESGDGQDSKRFSDILVGEVWLCSGQSNMELKLWPEASVGQHAGRETDGYFDGMTIDEPDVRAFQVGRDWSVEPLVELRKEAKWVRFSPQACFDLSAVAFHYALALRRSLKVPVGVIVSAYGGTPAQAWTPDAEKGYALLEKPVIGDELLQRQPRVLFNAMVAPLVPYAFRGVIWYQGEDNRGDGLTYRDRLECLYGGWSRAFEHPEMPFYLVEIAPFDYRIWETDDLVYRTEIREAQHEFAKGNPRVACIATADIGDLKSIHPDNKRTVALRLAATALNRAYGKPIACEGPVLKSWTAANGRVRLKFDNVTKWCMNGGERLPFEVAGETGPFSAATACIMSGDEIEVSSYFVNRPLHIRYCWSWLQHSKLKNENGYPLAPFRLDLPEESLK